MRLYDYRLPRCRGDNPVTLYRDRYRIESARLRGWNYAAAGCYFVTICTRDRICTLGEVVNSEVRLSAVGEIVAEEWLKTARLRNNITLDAWVIMPNHFHGIVWIHGGDNVETHCHASLRITANHAPRVETHCNASLRNAPCTNSFGPQRNNLSSVIRGFKGASTTRIHRANHPFAWQPRFHDQIIRDEKTLACVREYVRNNPEQWVMDRNCPING